MYVIEGPSAVKVGVARVPTDRLAQLQTGNPDPLRLVWSMPIAGDAYAVEAEAHSMLERHRLNGEWFAIPTEVAVAAVSGAAFRLGGTTDRMAIGPQRLSWPIRWCLAVAIPVVFWTLSLGPAPTAGCVLLLVTCLVLLWRARLTARGRFSPLPTRAFFVFVVPGLFLAAAWPGSAIAAWFGYR